MITKGDKAEAARDALYQMQGGARPTHRWIAFHSGRWSIISQFKGYLSTKQIDDELQATSMVLGQPFIDIYERILRENQ